MADVIRFDCRSDQSKRPEAIQFLMGVRRKAMRDFDRPMLIERLKGTDGVVVTRITEYPIDWKPEVREASGEPRSIPFDGTSDRVELNDEQFDTIVSADSETADAKPEPSQPTPRRRKRNAEGE